MPHRPDRETSAESSVRLGDLPRLDGELAFDAATRTAAANDHGRLISRTPRAVLRPGSTADIAEVVRWAAHRECPVTARGRGHSTYGRPLVDDGIVVDLTVLDTVHEVAEDHVIVGAGATWRAVLAATLPQGLAPPVLTDYLDLTVGGTLAVGGIGAMTHRFGLQTDQVRELEVVTGDGRVLTCSPRENADLFDSVRAGLGQFAIITRATLGLRPAPDHVRTYTLTYPSPAALMTDQQLLLREGRVDVVKGAIRAAPGGGWTYLLDLAVFDRSRTDDAVLAGLADVRPLAQLGDSSFAAYAHAFDRLEQVLRSTGEWAASKPWLMTFLPGSAAADVARAILDFVDPADLGEHGQLTVYPFGTGAIHTPLVRMPDEPVAFVLNLVRFSTAGGDDLARIHQQNRAAYDLVHAAGGPVYPVSALSLTEAEWQRHFGPAWPLVLSAKKAYDPAHRLTPGYELFPAR